MKKTILWFVPILLGLIAFGSGVGSNNAQTTLTVAISSPTVDVFTNASVTIQVLVTGEPSTVELLKNGNLLATLTEPYQFIWDTTGEVEGVYTLSARALKTGLAAPVVSGDKKITVDRTAPTITARAPVNGATNVYLKDEISLTFSEPILPSSVTAGNAQLQIDSSGFASAATLNPAGTKLVLLPTVLPVLPAAINLVVNGLTDRAGNALVASDTSFTAPDWQQPGTQPLNIKSGRNVNTDTFQRSLVLDSSGNPVVIWCEGDRFSSNIYVKRWNGTAWKQLGTSHLNFKRINGCNIPSMALDSSGNPVVAWREDNGTLLKLYVKRWDGTAWKLVGTTFLNVSTNKNAYDAALALDSRGNPIVVWYEGNSTSCNLYVKRWNGTAWKQVGATFIDANTDNDSVPPSSIAIDSSGNLVVAWRKRGRNFSYHLYVKRWNGAAWKQLGTTFLNIDADQNAFPPSLALDSSNNPVVGWSENNGTSFNIYTKRWNGTAWQQIGTRFLDPHTKSAGNSSMALDSSGNPVIAWREYDGTSENVYVKRWNGTAWQPVGTTFLDVNANYSAYNPSVALDSSGHLAVAWSESDGTVYVKRFNHIP